MMLFSLFCITGEPSVPVHKCEAMLLYIFIVLEKVSK